MTEAEARTRDLAMPGMCVLAIGVGIVAGFGAWLFRVLIGLFHNLLFLGTLNPYYDANTHTPASPWGAGIILAPVVGAILVTWLVKTFAPEAKGHGVPEVMDAIHYQRGIIRPVVALIKSVASALCIGSGGSVGREGPIIQIGSAFGSTLGQILHISPRQRVTLIAAGAGGGIAATFNAPMGGVVFAIELLLVSVNARNIVPLGLATVTACYIGRTLIGTHPSFDFSQLQIPDFSLLSPLVLVLFVPFGILMGLVTTVFIRGIYLAEDLFDKLPGNQYTRHMSGMLVVGVMIYLMQLRFGHYYVQGVGYATIMDVITAALTDPWFLLLLFVLKFLATCLTLGSGGSGGVFSPALFMGATFGAAFGLLANQLIPGMGIHAVSFALAGMAAAVGGSTGAMITGAVMLGEMTDDVNIAMPLIVTSVVAFGVRKMLCSDSIYTLKLIRRGHVVPEGLQAAIARAYRASHVMNEDVGVWDSATARPEQHAATLIVEQGEIRGVELTVRVQPEAAPVTLSIGIEKCIFAGLRQRTVDILERMMDAQARCAIIMNNPDSRDPADVAGIVSDPEILTFSKKTMELL